MLSQFSKQFSFPVDRKSLLGWLITLRWIVLPLQFLALIPGLIIGFVDSSNLGFFILTMASLGVFNFWAQSQYRKCSNPTQGRLLAHLAFDVGQLFTLLAMAGGWNNPFSSLMFVFAAFGGVLLQGLYKTWFVVWLVALIVALRNFFSPEILNRYPWTETVVDTFVEITVALSIVVLVSSLFENLMRQKRKLNQFKENQLRIDRLHAIGALSAGVCHQIATPINNLKLRLYRLERELEHLDQAKSFEDDFNSLKASMRHTEQAVKRLAQIHKRPEEEIWFEENLAYFITNVINSWKSLPEQRNITVEFSPRQNLKIRVPVGAFQQVLSDLLDNAKEAMSGKGKVYISISAEPKDRLVSIEIEDEGPGFIDEIYESLGEPFNSSKDRGSGLGLYHAKIVANLMGGDIQVANRNPLGAKVIFTISKEFVID